MSVLNQLDQLSFKKIISIGIFLALFFAVPTTVILVQQKTRLASRAAYVKPSPVTIAMNITEKPKGAVPVAPPEIGRLFPFLGKAGDIVFIQGKNFGNNPAVKSLKFNGAAIPDTEIAVWENDLIQFSVPVGAESGIVELSTGTHPVSKSYPFIVYDRETKTKLKKKGNVIVGINAEAVDHLEAWLGDDTHVIPVEGAVPAAAGERPILDTGGEPVLSIVLYNKANQMIPFYVSPVEFGF